MYKAYTHTRAGKGGNRIADDKRDSLRISICAKQTKQKRQRACDSESMNCQMG